jgi:hypothetical protein
VTVKAIIRKDRANIAIELNVRFRRTTKKSDVAKQQTGDLDLE